MKRLYLAMLIALALLLNGAQNGIGTSRNPRRNEHKSATAKEAKVTQQRQQEPTVPLSVCQAAQLALSQTLRTIQTQEETAAKHDRPQKDNWDKASVIASYLLFLIGALYTHYARRQWGEIRTQASLATKSLIETQKAADAAKANVETLIDAESAYLDITTIQFTAISARIENRGEGSESEMLVTVLLPGRPLVVSVTIKNVGRTPAFEVGTVVEFSCIPAFADWKPGQVVGRTKDIIGPNEAKTVECRYDHPFTQDHIWEIEHGRVVLHAQWHFSFTGIAEAIYDYKFLSFYKPLSAMREPEFDYPGPRNHRKRRK